MDEEHKEMLKEVPNEVRKELRLPSVVVRKQLTDSEKYQIISQYSQGIPVETIASSVSRDTTSIRDFIFTTLNSMVSIKETNDLLKVQCSADIRRIQGTAPTRFLTADFLSKLEDTAEIYAYYYSQTGDNKFSLAQAGLDGGLSVRMPKQTRDYILRIRGQYLREIPSVKKYIQEVQDQRIQEYRCEKPQVQMELVSQIEELKEVVADDPKQRGNLLKALELLGRTIGAFTDRVEVEEADAKSGLQIILERARKEAMGPGTYEVTDVEETDGETNETTTD
jgi:hypothetical protein